MQLSVEKDKTSNETTKPAKKCMHVANYELGYEMLTPKIIDGVHERKCHTHIRMVRTCNIGHIFLKQIWKTREISMIERTRY